VSLEESREIRDLNSTCAKVTASAGSVLDSGCVPYGHPVTPSVPRALGEGSELGT